jgi:DNA-binding response OmpR family regulator
MDSNKKLIVIVEDDDIVTNILTERLKKAGYMVEIANNGRAGLDLILKKRPDLVLLDIILPEIDGLEVLNELKNNGFLPDLPVIIISNSGQPVEIKRFFQLGAVDYLIKVNFNPNEVLEKVRRILPP